MNKNILIAVLALAGGGWYLHSRGGVSTGTVNAEGVYSDSAKGFALSFPGGWKKAEEKDISPENGFTFRPPESDRKSSLVMVGPGPDKAVVFLRQTKQAEADMKTFAVKSLRGLHAAGVMGTAYREGAAEGRRLPRIKADNVTPAGGLFHVTFFPAGGSVFMLISVGEKGFSPNLLEQFEWIADSARRI
ncbi:MAG: hypothetical protein A2X35_00835 [Elusimicrobia bacterium GWA2_61_42]|nr:MAG: hypothetical protein A2X35_00835 [Elusimicrobia bacterium GWA2_61_42]OGR75239.1 MAG: hypothetical protein A2X38_04950 [Elusimicrobia bacterium GWC2_61_25]